MKGVIEYLAELSPELGEKLLKSVWNDEINLQLKLGGEDKVISTRLLKTDHKNQFALSGKAFSLNHLATFKIEIRNDIYFFKTEVFQENRKNVIQKPFQIFRLVRRKERRFEIPAAWSQQTLILASEQMKLNTRANILEISQSGIKIHALSDLLRFEKEGLIKIQFRLHKRSEMTASGIIRHVRRNKDGGFTLGIEFVKNSTLTETKIQSICEDLFFHYTHTRRFSHK
ncbi:MAG: PilZ domain-containing protein [Bdellovibrio sp.]|nr:PilZ domain-containing protein [Bdellovibrio sp.]